ncbi:MAG: hypothetical protein U0105_26515 [Candidatus Obscuribacterales bacterium]
MQEDQNLRTTGEIYKPRPWFLRTAIIGLITGFVLGIIGTIVLGLCMSAYGNTSVTDVFTGEKFMNYLPAIGLVGPIFSVFAVILVSFTKLLERIKPPEDF